MMFANASHLVDLYDRGVAGAPPARLGSVYGVVTRPVRWVTEQPDGLHFTVSDAAFLTELWPDPAALEQGHARVTDLILGTTRNYDIEQVSVSAASWTMTLALTYSQVSVA